MVCIDPNDRWRSREFWIRELWRQLVASTRSAETDYDEREVRYRWELQLGEFWKDTCFARTGKKQANRFRSGILILSLPAVFALGAELPSEKLRVRSLRLQVITDLHFHFGEVGDVEQIAQAREDTAVARAAGSPDVHLAQEIVAAKNHVARRHRIARMRPCGSRELPLTVYLLKI
jgi:hypothetical protein